MTTKSYAILNALHRGQALATPIKPSSPKYLAWVGVYPLDITRETTRELLRNNEQAVPLPAIHAYRIRWFETHRSFIEQEISISEPELMNCGQSFAFGDDGLQENLEKLGVSIDDLMPIHKSDYPI